MEHMRTRNKPAARRSGPILRVLSTLVVAAALSACGGPDFEAVTQYKLFLEKAKPSLTKMNQVREDLFQISDPNEMLTKFRDQLLPEVERLSKLADEHPTPEVSRLAEIHVTLRNVMKDYAVSTRTLVDRLEAAEKDPKRTGDELDSAREQALVGWGEDDQKFGGHMAKLVADLSSYLDDQMKQ